ncbi:SMC-Scp complex subunit ScpB [Candidatus Woesearchaeota archaeon]|nr:SMC-Scp complex subunit ScpB [Candidatus Woesearchaeota archaeon]
MAETKGVKDVEAVLFASGKAMEEDHIKELTQLKPKETKTALEALKKKYQETDGALFIWNEGTKWKINVKEAFIPLVKTLAAETELARAVLETLAMIAYRSPVLQSEIINTRGEGAYAHINELVEKGFVTKEKFGRSFKLKIADKFYHYFDVAGDKDIREAFKGAKQPDPEKYAQQEQKKLGALEIVQALSDEEAEKQRQETQLEIYDINQQLENDKRGFLNGFDDKLQEAKARINDAEEHILKQKQEAEARKEEEGEEAPPEEETEQKDYEDMDPQAFAKEIEKQVDEISEEKKED